MESGHEDPSVSRAIERANSSSYEELAARYEAVLASMLDPVVTIDEMGTIQSVSNSIERVFGWTPEELLGVNIRVLMGEPHRSQHDEYLSRYRQTGRTNILGRPRQFEAQRKDGSLFQVEIAVARVQGPGRQMFTGIIRDVTERHRIEQELSRYRAHLESLVAERTSELESSHERLRLSDRLASIGTLAAGLGHDMSNVLFPTRCRLDALDALDLPDAARVEIAAIRESVEYLQKLTNGLRHFSMNPERLTDARHTQISTWWDEACPLLVKLVPKRATLDVSFDSDLPPIAVAPHRLTQAVFNLLVNASEAVEDCEPAKVMITARLSGDGRYVRLSVSDNGHGMSSEVKRHAMDPFYTTKSRGLSTGLGLSLVHGVAKAAHGSVEIESEPSRGTTVSMMMIVSPEDREAAAGEADARALEIVVSVQNERLRAFVFALFQGTRHDVLNMPDPDIDDVRAADMWIVEGSTLDQLGGPVAIDDVEDARHALLVIGPASLQVHASRLMRHVTDSSDLPRLRNETQALLTHLQEVQ